MNAVPKKTVQARSPPTLAELQAEVADLEHQLHQTRRGESAARNDLPRAIVAGDAEVIARGREDIAFCQKRIEELSAQLETARQAAQLAEQRDRGKANGQAYSAIRKLVANELAALEGLEGAITAFAEAYAASKAGLNAVDVRMRQAGVEPDPMVLRAKLQGIADRLLCLATDREFGSLRGLATPDDLRRSGAASLTMAAREWQVVTLRQARHALHIPEET